MAKRFTDTDKWKKPFIRTMKAPYKLLWLYILDECDHAGVWQVDFDVAQIKIGEKLNATTALKFFEEKVVPFDNGEKWFIPDFIDFQYGTLNSENRAHNSVIQILDKHNLRQSLEKNKPLTSPLQGAMDKDMDKDKDKDKEQTGSIVIDSKQKFVAPTIDEVIEYFVENGYTESAARTAHEHYRLANWHNTKGKKVLNWKQTMHTNWFKEQYREKKLLVDKMANTY
jgi:hypothetical protein